MIAPLAVITWWTIPAIIAGILIVISDSRWTPRT